MSRAYPSNPVLAFQVTAGSNLSVQANGFGFRISWATNTPVVVEAAKDLANPTWTPVSTNTLTDGSAYFTDPQWTNSLARFYRLRRPRCTHPAAAARGAT